jgi:chromosome segregation ATPase
MTPAAQKILTETRALAVSEIEQHKAALPMLQAEADTAAAAVRHVTATLRGLQSAIDGAKSPAGLISGAHQELQDQLSKAKGHRTRAANAVETTRVRLAKLEAEIREIDSRLHPENANEEAA